MRTFKEMIAFRDAQVAAAKAAKEKVEKAVAETICTSHESVWEQLIQAEVNNGMIGTNEIECCVSDTKQRLLWLDIRSNTRNLVNNSAITEWFTNRLGIKIDAVIFNEVTDGYRIRICGNFEEFASY